MSDVAPPAETAAETAPAETAPAETATDVQSLTEFLDADRPELRAKAAETILSLTGSLEQRIELNAAEVPKALCSLVRDEAAAKHALSALINLSADSDRVAIDQMLAAAILDDVTEILFSPRAADGSVQELGGPHAAPGDAC